MTQLITAVPIYPRMSSVLMMMENHLEQLACLFLEDTGAVVVRYFGGIKLGAGGLIRAYSNATLKAIDIAKKVEKISIRKYELKVSYEISSRIDYYLRNNTQLIDTIYDVDVTYIYATNDDIEDKILEYTKGIRPVYLENIDIEVDV